jgi:hypothetical protein
MGIKYSDSNVLDYLPADKGKRLYGVEMEIEYTSRTPSGTDATVERFVQKDAILKCESTISEGFELVTRPMTMENQKKFWRSFTDFRQAEGLRLRSYYSGRCGMHVHVTKASVTQLTLGKLLVFVNEERNKEFIVKIGGRESSWANIKLRYSQLPKNVKRYEDDCDKYLAVGNRYTTLEYRLFRGNLRLPRILANLEFVESSLMFAQDSSIKQLSHHDFIRYVMESGKWTHLKGLLKEENYA